MHELSNGCEIGTPGRLIDFLERRYIQLSEVKFLSYQIKNLKKCYPLI